MFSNYNTPYLGADEKVVPLNEERIVRADGSRVILSHYRDLIPIPREAEPAKWRKSLEEVRTFKAIQFNARNSQSPDHEIYYGQYAALVLTESESDFHVGHLSVKELQEEIEKFWGVLEPMTGPIYESWLSYFIKENHTFGLVHAWITVFLETSIAVADETLRNLGLFQGELAPRYIHPEYPLGHSAAMDGIPAPAFTRPIIRNVSSDGCKAIQLENYPSCSFMYRQRRVFDVCANRVIPLTWFPYRFNVAEPVSHAWVALQDRQYIMTNINQRLWPIPVPRGVEIEAIRQELIKLEIRYAWLDVFCLRQPSSPVQYSLGLSEHHGQDWNLTSGLSADMVAARESRRVREWEVDVPTSGLLFRACLVNSCARVVLWLSGLGRKFRDEGWDDPHHWLQRVWTIQETQIHPDSFRWEEDEDAVILAGLGDSPYSSFYKIDGGIKWRNPRHCQVDISGTSLYQAMDRAAPYKATPGTLIGPIIEEIQRRHCTMPVDRVTILSSILTHVNLRCGRVKPCIPTYDASETPEEAWERLVTCLADLGLLMLCTLYCCGERSNTPVLQLLRLFPNPSAQHWFPSWTQVMAYPDMTLLEPQLLDGTLPRKNRGLQIFSGRLYRLCKLQVLPRGEVQDSITYTRVKVTARNLSGGVCTVNMTSRIPKSLLEDILAADTPLVLLDITPCADNQVWPGLPKPVPMGTARPPVPLWSSHLILVCRELSAFKMPSSTDPQRGAFGSCTTNLPVVYQYRLRRVTTLEWTTPSSSSTPTSCGSEQNWLPFKVDLGSRAANWWELDLPRRIKSYFPNGVQDASYLVWDVPVGFEMYLQ